jgi:TonB family protein
MVLVTHDHLEEIMRRILVASLLLSPLFTAAAVASQPATDAVAPTQVVRVSTGVTDAQIAYPTNVDAPASLGGSTPTDGKVVLKVNVDAMGTARGIQVVKSVNADLDARAIAAVRQFRFHPATLDNQAVPVTVNLTVVMKL